MNWLPYSLPLADANKTFWFPEQASTFAAEVDSFFYFILWLSVFFFVLIVGGMAYFIWKYRERPGYRGNPEAEHNTPLEITWTVLPTFIVIYIFVRGAAGYLNMSRAPAETLDIQVQAQKWAWTFTYPNGAVSPELHLPIDQPAKMVMRSSDVIHSFFVPAFRAKSDVVPGRYNLMWFQPTKEGTYDLLCTEYCGDKHSEMLAKVTVHSKEAYEKWVTDAAKPPEDPVEHGKWIYERYGCKSCHSLDGTKVVVPASKAPGVRTSLWLPGRDLRHSMRTTFGNRFWILKPRREAATRQLRRCPPTKGGSRKNSLRRSLSSSNH
jgi:cytochrome c oxidase subunit 2